MPRPGRPTGGCGTGGIIGTCNIYCNSRYGVEASPPLTGGAPLMAQENAWNTSTPTRGTPPADVISTVAVDDACPILVSMTRVCSGP